MTTPRSRSPGYDVWYQMLYRCENPKCRDYPVYGARGVKVCARWHSFDAFIADMGPPPPGLTLERVDTDGDYEPSNCIWASRQQQARNRRANKLTAHYADQIRHLVRDGVRPEALARVYGVSSRMIYYVVNDEFWRTP